MKMYFGKKNIYVIAKVSSKPLSLGDDTETQVRKFEYRQWTAFWDPYKR